MSSSTAIYTSPELNLPVEPYVPVHKKAANFLNKVWKKVPSRDKLNRVKNGFLDTWRCAENLEHLTKRIMQTETWKNLFVTASTTTEVVVTAGNETGKIVKITASIRTATTKISEVARKATRWGDLLAISTTPFACWGVGKKCMELIRGGCSRFDHSLIIIGDIGEIMGNVARFSYGLANFGLLSPSQIAFAWPLSIVGSIFEVAVLVVNVRSLGQTILFARRFDAACSIEKDGSISDENFIRAMQFLACQDTSTWKTRSKHTNMLSKHLNTNGYELDLKLEEIRKNPDGFSFYEKAGFVKTLRNRVIAKQCTTSLNILSKLTGSIASAIFILTPFFCPVATPAGFAFAAVCNATCVVRLTQDWVTEYHFNKAIKSYMQRFKPAESLEAV